MKPLIIHHNDHDGKMAATIVINEILNMFPKDQISTIEYNYGWNIKWDKMIPDEDNSICYIVDVSLNDEIHDVIRKIKDRGWTIVHIDHHKSTLDYVNDHNDNVIDDIVTWYRTDLSATMLTYLFSNMSLEDRKNPDKVKLDFANWFTHVMLNIGESNRREIRIPNAIRYVDDYDTWRHSDPESMAFHYGIDISTKFQGVINTVQRTEFKASIEAEMTVWEDALYSDDNTVYNRYVLPGRYIVAYRKEDFRKTLRRGFDFRLMESYDAFAVNAAGGSDLFGAILDKYDVCIAYWYDGAYDCWRYAVRSGENSKFDCAEFCKKYGGGGHFHAAGFQSEKDVTYDWTYE